MWVARQHANELPPIRISNSPRCADTASRSRGLIRPSFAIYFPPSSIRGRRECRAPDAPAAACAMVVVESTRVSQVTPESPGIPHAMVLTASFALSPATGLSCHRRLRTCIRKLDTSVGVSGPHDFSVRLSALRPKAHPRPPHPAPRFVTLRNAPLWDRTARVVEMICPTGKAEYFCKQDWIGKLLICPSGKSVDVYDHVVTRLRCFPRLPLCRAVIE